MGFFFALGRRNGNGLRSGASGDSGLDGMVGVGRRNGIACGRGDPRGCCGGLGGEMDGLMGIGAML
jgi:hypothetical protein